MFSINSILEIPNVRERLIKIGLIIVIFLVFLTSNYIYSPLKKIMYDTASSTLAVPIGEEVPILAKIAVIAAGIPFINALFAFAGVFLFFTIFRRGWVYQNFEQMHPIKKNLVSAVDNFASSCGLNLIVAFGMFFLGFFIIAFGMLFEGFFKDQQTLIFMIISISFIIKYTLETFFIIIYQLFSPKIEGCWKKEFFITQVSSFNALVPAYSYGRFIVNCSEFNESLNEIAEVAKKEGTEISVNSMATRANEGGGPFQTLIGIIFSASPAISDLTEVKITTKNKETYTILIESLGFEYAISKIKKPNTSV